MFLVGGSPGIGAVGTLPKLLVLANGCAPNEVVTAGAGTLDAAGMLGGKDDAVGVALLAAPATFS